jgi:hypothetical protein
VLFHASALSYRLWRDREKIDLQLDGPGISPDTWRQWRDSHFGPDLDQVEWWRTGELVRFISRVILIISDSLLI